MIFDDDQMWKHSEIMTSFVNNYIDKLSYQLEPATNDTVIEASIEDDQVPVVDFTDAIDLTLIDKQVEAIQLIETLNKIAADATKYNNEKVSYAIELAISEIKVISGLDQE